MLTTTDLEPVADLALDVPDLFRLHVQHPPLLLLHAVPESHHQDHKDMSISGYEYIGS